MPGRRLNQLTAREVACAKDGSHADGGGLYLRVSGGGSRRSWVFRFTRDGKVTETGLGPSTRSRWRRRAKKHSACARSSPRARTRLPSAGASKRRRPIER